MATPARRAPERPVVRLALAGVAALLLSLSCSCALVTRLGRVPRGPVPGEAWRVPRLGMEFVWIEQLGIWVGKYEVTNAEYRRKEPRHSVEECEGHDLNGDMQPVTEVTWNDVCAFAVWLTARERAAGRLPAELRYRLPTEKEFMAYAQCGDNRKYPWGNTWPPRSGQAGNYADRTASASFPKSDVIEEYSDGHKVSCDVAEDWANPWGLVGVGGNAWECCATGDGEKQSFGAWRGASWANASWLPCSYRIDYYSSRPNSVGGFRLALSR